MSEALQEIGSVADRPRGEARATLLSAALAATGPLLAHLGAVGPAIEGWGVPGAPLDDGDTVYSLALADDAWRWLLEARSVGDVLRVPVEARVLNALDLVVAVWPARALAGLIGAAPALAALHVGWDPLESTCRHASLSIL